MTNKNILIIPICSYLNLDVRKGQICKDNRRKAGIYLWTNIISGKSYTISQGSKQWRGQINSINSFLNYLDIDYRESLYNHSMLHYSKGNLDNNWKDETLTKEHFTFRNIHQNLGNIRW